MLILKNVKKSYGEKENVVNALKGVSINFPDSEFVSILGPSGCGKTTLLNIIGGLDRYTEGDLVINGVSTKTYKDRDWDTYRNHSIGFVFQSYNLIPHLTILENVELTVTLGGMDKQERKRRAKDALISVGLKEKLNKKPNELSGGQMQRVSIARAIVGEPDIILADEPTGALDTETSESIMKLLKEISKTKLVIMVTHNPSLAYKYSDRIIEMLDGEVIGDNTLTEMGEAIAKDLETKLKAEENLVNGENAEQNVSEVNDITTEQKINSDIEKDLSNNKENKTVDSDDVTAKKNEKVDGKSAVNSKKYNKKYSSMSILTALKLSSKNLLSKLKRTIITSFASSIGIIGIAIVLSISSGMQAYIDNTMQNTASFNFVSITAKTYENGIMGGHPKPNDNGGLNEFPSGTTGVIPYDEDKNKPEIIKQNLSKEFIEYLQKNTANDVIDITYSYNVTMNVLSKTGDSYKYVNTSFWNECMSNEQYLADRYDVLSSIDGASIPTKDNEVALVVDTFNRLPIKTLTALDIPYEEGKEINYSDLLGKEYRIVFNDGWYTKEGEWYEEAHTSNYDKAYQNENGITVKITSILRLKQDAKNSWLSEGIAYSPSLTKKILDNNSKSAVAIAQAENKTINVTTGKEFSSSSGLPNMPGIPTPETYESMLEKLGYTTTPSTIIVYPNDVNAKNRVLAVIDEWNKTHEEKDDIIYTDMSSMLTSMFGEVIDIVTYVLVAFSALSLVISSIMIAIIIYASVIERTKEIGVLRSIGARKKDVSRVFKAEAALLGLISGIIAVLVTLIANAIINAVISDLVGVTGIANMTALIAFGMIGLSVLLLLIASLIPARLAAKKEPAVALRTE